jgi:hypothetical protein
MEEACDRNRCNFQGYGVFVTAWCPGGCAQVDCMRWRGLAAKTPLSRQTDVNLLGPSRFRPAGSPDELRSCRRGARRRLALT